MQVPPSSRRAAILDTTPRLRLLCIDPSLLPLQWSGFVDTLSISHGVCGARVPSQRTSRPARSAETCFITTPFLATAPSAPTGSCSHVCCCGQLLRPLLGGCNFRHPNPNLAPVHRLCTASKRFRSRHVVPIGRNEAVWCTAQWAEAQTETEQSFIYCLLPCFVAILMMNRCRFAE